MGRFVFACRLLQAQTDTRCQQKTDAAIQGSARTAAIRLGIRTIRERIIPSHPVIIDPVSVLVQRRPIERFTLQIRSVARRQPVRSKRWWKTRAAGISL